MLLGHTAKEVAAEIVPNGSKAPLVKVIRDHVSAESVIYTDGWPDYNGLVDGGYSTHLRGGAS
ncbi:MAG: transposase [Desulfobulbaceae bacterium]|nr:transposase [Desulfobulbaceae bacterium]